MDKVKEQNGKEKVVVYSKHVPFSIVNLICDVVDNHSNFVFLLAKAILI